MIRVLAFARYRDTLGFQRVELDLPEPATLGALLAQARFAALPEEALLAVNQTFCQRDQPLEDGDEIALMPPVSGG